MWILRSYGLCKYLLLIAIKGIYFGRQCAQCFYIHDVKHLLPDDVYESEQKLPTLQIREIRLKGINFTVTVSIHAV